MGGCLTSPQPTPSVTIVNKDIGSERNVTAALDELQMTQKEIDYLSRVTKLDSLLIQKLFERFNQISESRINDGVIDADEFSHALGMNNNILSHRMFALFNVTKSERMNFREFAMAAALLSDKADFRDKLRCMLIALV